MLSPSINDLNEYIFFNQSLEASVLICIWSLGNLFCSFLQLKFMFSKMGTKIDKKITVDLTVCSKCQIYDEDFVNFSGLLRKYEL